MYDAGRIITGLIIALALFLFPFYWNAGSASKAPEPELTPRAREAKVCVEETSFMRTNHMKLLDQWRHQVVRDAERYYTTEDCRVFYKSLQISCMDCHSNKTKFCDLCHNYMDIAPYCWDCHIAPEESSNVNE